MEQHEGSIAEAPQSAPKPAGYEFNAAQNATIHSLAQRMKIMGVFYMILGGFAALGGLFLITQSLPSALVIFLEVALFGFIGWWNYKAAESFHLIVQTRGNDISYLMNALDGLRKIYNLQVWLIVVVLGLLALGVVVMVVLSV